MKPRALFALLCCVCLLFPRQTKAETTICEAPRVTARACALFEAESGRFVTGKNENERLPMASTTKVMTALLALERGDLNAEIEIPNEAVGQEGSSMYLGRGERMTLSDLLYGLLLTSGNDAAVAIAIHIGGSVENFCALMNERALSLGCKDTHFVNPNGLPNENHYTSARDLGKIAVTAMQNETFRKIVSTTYYETQSGDKTRALKNKNKLLWSYDGGNGVKTGFTKAAGRCLVFSAEQNGVLLTGVILNAPDLWNDAIALLDCGFACFTRRKFVSAGTPCGFVAVSDGAKKELAICAKDDILYAVTSDEWEHIGWRVETETALTAPVAQGAIVGTLTLCIYGVGVKSVSLVAAEAMDSLSLRQQILRLMEDWVA